MEKTHVAIVEVSSSYKIKSIEGQNEIESESAYQVKQIDHVHHFMDIRKIGANIKHNIIPKIFYHETSQTRTLSIVDYEK
jgi:hypothetical protein